MFSWTATSKSPLGFFKVSNLLTYLSLLAGTTAIFVSRELDSWSFSGGLIAISAVLDMLDGRFARRFPRSDRERKFGAHLDSLADSIVFGWVPVACLFQLSYFGPTPFRFAWWVAAFLHVLAAITRLGFFNAHHEDEGGANEFVGVPTTLIGLIWATAFLFRPAAEASGALLLLCSVLMVIPLRIPRPQGTGILVYLGWGVLVAGLHLIWVNS